MSSLPVFVGLDYHQDSVQVCVLDSTGRQLANRSVANDAAAVAAVARRHGRPLRIAVEACCGAAAMADDAKVPSGTRYDALRMIALDAWDKQRERLAGYLAKGTHDELMMGAISGLSDVDEPPVAELLLSGLDHYSTGNRKLALDALLRTDARTVALVEALEKGRVKPAALGDTHMKALKMLKNESLRARALKVLPP